MGKEKTTRKGPNRIVALITYAIALVCLLLGLFLPFGNGDADTAGNMLGLQLPAAINSLHSFSFLESIVKEYPFAYNFHVSFGGKFTLDFGAVLVLLYALITLMGVVALIPVIANTASKKAKKNVALRAASFIEVLAVAVLSCLFFFIIPHAVVLGEGVKALNNWSLIAALGGTLLMLIVQAFIYKKGSGAIKFVLALLSIIAVVTSLYGITAFLPFLDGKLPAVGNFVYGVYGTDFMGTVVPVQAYDNILTLFAFGIPQGDAKSLTLFFCTVIVYYAVLANLVFDLMGLGKKTNKAMLVLNVVRYGVELAAAAVIIIVAAITEGAAIGLLSIAIAVLALIALIINIIRLVGYKGKKAKKAAKAQPVEATEATAVANEEKPAKETRKERKEREKAEKLAAKQAAEEAAKAQREAEKAEREAAKAQAQAQKAETAAVAAQTAEPVDSENDIDNPSFYRPVIYKGPVDEFIRLLTNEEKVEFARVFIERQNGPLTGVPEYVVGGENAKFFASVFIYFAKIRDLVSDGLMNQLYKQANVMR